jgi:hypothetical protein
MNSTYSVYTPQKLNDKCEKYNYKKRNVNKIEHFWSMGIPQNRNNTHQKQGMVKAI